MNKTPRITTIILMAIFAFSLISCEEKKVQSEDPAAREARREARREAQKEEIKKELQAEAQAEAQAQAAAAASAKKAQERQKIEAELQKLRAERAQIETEIPNAQRNIERANNTANNDRVAAQVAINDANAAQKKLFGAAEKERTIKNANLLSQKATNSAAVAQNARIRHNSLVTRLNEINNQEAAAAKKLQSLRE